MKADVKRFDLNFMTVNRWCGPHPASAAFPPANSASPQEIERMKNNCRLEDRKPTSMANRRTLSGAAAHIVKGNLNRQSDATKEQSGFRLELNEGLKRVRQGEICKLEETGIEHQEFLERGKMLGQRQTQQAGLALKLKTALRNPCPK